MKQHSETREVKIMGVDLAKNSLYVYGVDGDGCKAVDAVIGFESSTRQQPGMRTIGKKKAKGRSPICSQFRLAETMNQRRDDP